MKLAGLYLRHARKPVWSSAERYLASAVRPKGDPGPPGHLRQRHAVVERVVEGFHTYTVTPVNLRPKAPAVMYLHGGGYVNEIARQHWDLVSEIADQGMVVEVPIYGLTPQFHWRDAFRFVPAVYAAMARSHGDRGVILSGDSAGGGLALGLTSALSELGLPMPHSLVLISPWMDVSCSNPVLPQMEPLDPWLGLAGARIAGQHWADGHDMADPRLSPLHMDGAHLPPTHIYTGTLDLIYPDIALFCERHPEVRLTVCEGAVHVYPLLPVTEGKAARRQILAGLRLTSK